MDKLKMHSPDITVENIEKIAALFPNCITEIKSESVDAQGKLTSRLTKAIDFDLLKQELSGSIVDGPQERYHLNWPGKREALLTANAPIAKTLRPCREDSVNFDTTENLFIEGDNLEALKLLQETYLGKVKMIYIDPPYNTGKDFIYADNFAENSDDYLKRSDQKDDDGNRLITNSESNGRFHSDWLSMMYSRLKLARNLLKDDGVIFISIDDNEVSNLRKLGDEIFGNNNFIANIVWQKKYAATNDAKGFSNLHDHILVYKKSDQFERYLLPRTEEQNKPYKNDDGDGKGLWRSDNLLVRSFSKSGVYPILNPNTEKEYFPSEGNCWRASKETMKTWLKENKIFFGKDGKGAPQLKRYLNEVQQGRVPNTWWTFQEVGHNDAANKELKALFQSKSPFDTPKPTTLIQQMLRVATKSNDIVMDFFSGSGTTPHAVMKMNSEDGGNRKFIAVQLAEKCNEKSEGYRAGYKTIFEISRKRIELAGIKIVEGKNHASWNQDIGFRVLKIDTSNMSDVYYNPENNSQLDLLAQVENIKADRTDEDLLFQVLLDWGVGLTLPISKKQILGKDVFFVGEGVRVNGDLDGLNQGKCADLIACFDKNITDDLVKELAQLQPLRIVFRDDGFGSLQGNGFDADAVKINAQQIFKQLSPATDVKSL